MKRKAATIHTDLLSDSNPQPTSRTWFQINFVAVRSNYKISLLREVTKDMDIANRQKTLLVTLCLIPTLIQFKIKYHIKRILIPCWPQVKKQTTEPIRKLLFPDWMVQDPITWVRCISPTEVLKTPQNTELKLRSRPHKFKAMTSGKTDKVKDQRRSRMTTKIRFSKGQTKSKVITQEAWELIRRVRTQL